MTNNIFIIKNHDFLHKIIIYLNYFQAVEIPGIKIFHYCGTLNFANINHFKSELYKLIGINPKKL